MVAAAMAKDERTSKSRRKIEFHTPVHWIERKSSLVVPSAFIPIDSIRESVLIKLRRCR